MDLPLQADPTNSTATGTNDPSIAYNPYIADPIPRSRLIHITHYGRPRSLCPPVLAHAAILNFFARVDRLLGTSRFDLADAGDITGGRDGPRARDADGQRVAREPDGPVQSMPGNQQVVVFRPRESLRGVERNGAEWCAQAGRRDTSRIRRRNVPRYMMRIISGSRDAMIRMCHLGWPLRIGMGALPGAGRAAL